MSTINSAVFCARLHALRPNLTEGEFKEVFGFLEKTLEYPLGFTEPAVKWQSNVDLAWIEYNDFKKMRIAQALDTALLYLDQLKGCGEC